MTSKMFAGIRVIGPPPDLVGKGPPDFGVMDPPISSQWDQLPEPLFDPEGRDFASSRLQEWDGDASRNDRFSRVASVWVLPDRGSCAVCGGRLSAITAQSGRRNSQELDEDADVSTESWKVQATFIGCYFVSSYCLRLITTDIAFSFDPHVLGYESHG
jgi:hypothetical protein